MPQDVRDLLHRRASAQKSARHAVAENVDAGPLPSTSSVAGQHRAFDALGRNRFVVGGNMSNKYGPVRRLGPLLVQIGRNRRSRRGRQGQNIGASALGADKLDRAVGPVDVVKLQLDDLAGSQTEIDQTPHHRIGPQA